jgi:hypothetical protein
MAQNRTFESYEKHLRIYGPVGVLDAARRDLDEQDYERLARLVEAAQRPQKGRRRG